MARAFVSLPVVLVITGASLLVLGSTMTWTSTSTRMTDRNIQYFNAVAAAEAATEKVITFMFRDFRAHAINTNLEVYRTNIPVSADIASRFQFLDATSNANRVSLLPYVPHGNTALAEDQYEYGYQIIANARSTTDPNPVPAAVRQVVTFSNDPIFRYAIYYSLSLEICPNPPMTIIGKVHSQKNIYYSPNSTLKFLQNVTAVGNLIPHRDPESNMPDQNGPTIQPPPPHLFQSGAPSKSLPVGTNNSPEAVHAIVEKPPPGEDINSPIGKQRYFNNVDMILTVNDTNVVATTGPRIKSQVVATNADVAAFVETANTFFNGRENKPIASTDIDVGLLKSWIESGSNPINNVIQSERGHNINSVYVDDQRTRASGQGAGVRVVNGRYLPPDGLTIATKDPLYVRGHYNAPNLATTNTANAKPASLVGDAITVLSEAWNDADNTQLNSPLRVALATTVNAAFLAGIVPSKSRSTSAPGYSGGVENFPRFLENWSSRAFTYNGSMVVMFPSQQATNTWCRADNKSYYSPPIRDWSFDVNYLKPDRLPPCTPQLRTLARDRLEIVRVFSEN
jgi:hypothetical protein